MIKTKPFSISKHIVQLAYLRVKENRGSAGIDGMSLEKFEKGRRENLYRLWNRMSSGSYMPLPVKLVEIPKQGGGNRPLGILTVTDRIAQMVVTLTLGPELEHVFHKDSYGYRSRKSALEAVGKTRQRCWKYDWVLDLDIKSFFDNIPHDLLMKAVRKHTDCKWVLLYIKRWIIAPYQHADGSLTERKKGIPQGAVLSPLLSNIMLNELDKELEKRGHRFARYGDDLVILCRSKRSADRTLANIVPYIENKLFLKVNREKTKAAYIRGIKFLGYSFYVYKGEGRLRVHPRSIAKMKERIKTLTSRSNGWGYARRKEALRQYITGWVNYFKLADMKMLLLRVDEWYRRRLRMVIWKQWKRLRTRGRNLMKLGIVKYKAWEFANTRKGYWHTANSPILASSVTSKSLRHAGFTFFWDYYRLVNGTY